jgi:hypothetical protein
MCADVLLEQRPNVTAEAFVEVPREARVALEESLERIVDMIALSGHARRHLLSPLPHVLLLPEDDDERKWLADMSGLGGPTAASGYWHTDCRFPVDGDTLGALSDRWDGASLLADTLSAGEAMSRFRELNRFFESAFARSASKLVQPLHDFLAGAPMGFSPDEVRHWVVSLRHPSVHADRGRSPARPRDVSFVEPRMMAAAYDVLLNKAHWHTPDVARRNVWRAWSGSSDSSGGGLYVTPGKAAKLAYTPFDQFAVYPLAMDVLLPQAPIPGAWPLEVGRPSEG